MIIGRLKCLSGLKMNKPNFQDRLDEIIKEAKGVMFDDNDFRTLRYIAPPEVTKTALTQLFKDYIKAQKPTQRKGER